MQLKTDLPNLKKYKEENNELKKIILNLQRMAELGNLTLDISHDLKNIFTAIDGNKIILLKINSLQKNLTAQTPSIEETFDEIKKICLVINEAVKYGKELCKSINEFIGSNQEKTLTSLDSIINSCLIIYKTKLASSGITILYDKENHLPKILCNRSGIQRIFINLINNAVHAMRESKERILSIQLKKRIGYVSFSISDTGEGISTNILGHTEYCHSG